LNQEKYVIIVGSKGSGKTTLLKHVLNEKKGIVFIKIDGKVKLENLEKKLSKHVGKNHGWLNFKKSFR
jgi:ABC-type lipoprotein export system ATPase subunit